MNPDPTLADVLDAFRRFLRGWLLNDFPWPPPRPADAPRLLSRTQDSTAMGQYNDTYGVNGADSTLAPTRRVFVNIDGTDQPSFDQPADQPTFVVSTSDGQVVTAATALVTADGIQGPKSPISTDTVVAPPPAPDAPKLLSRVPADAPAA